MEKKKCFECSGDADCEHHVVPQSLGGTQTVWLCGMCHGKAHHSNKNMSTRSLTKAALAHKKSKGERVGKIPYGHDLSEDGITLQVNHREQATIELIHRLRSTELSYCRIARLLNRKGILTKENSKWESTTVLRIYRRTLREMCRDKDPNELPSISDTYNLKHLDRV